uniref:Uncharacterized protein n=1 Tax=Cajanus cajan TaxID=3821 RepID=A0A151UBE7_CAJCA|nr:hypothetical protein KK1_020850 [Cajanus cajan]
MKKKRTVLACLHRVQLELERVGSESLVRLEKTLQVELNEVSLQEELLWFQNSREKWVKFGDRNSKFFHAQTLSRIRRNKIWGLFFLDGTWQTDPSLLQVKALCFFTQLFSSKMLPPIS